MADLTAHARDKLSPKQFGLPGVRKYPMPDAEHASLALGRVTQMVDEGKISSTDAAKVRRKAHKVLGD